MRLGGRRGKPSLAPTRESETDIGRGPGEAPWGPRVGAGRGTESAAFLFERGARLAGGAYEPSSVRRRGCENRADPHVVVASRAAGMGPCVEETEAAFTRSRPNQRRRGARGGGAEEGGGAQTRARSHRARRSDVAARDRSLSGISTAARGPKRAGGEQASPGARAGLRARRGVRRLACSRSVPAQTLPRTRPGSSGGLCSFSWIDLAASAIFRGPGPPASASAAPVPPPVRPL